MDVVLGVSMTPAAGLFVLVEGDQADGVTVDHHRVHPGSVQRVVSAIIGTRESVTESGHRLKATGVAWTDHRAAGELREALRANNIDDVVLVSPLHAAGALAQAVGLALGYDRTALMFLERDAATAAVVRTADGAVIRVRSRSLRPGDTLAELRAMVGELEASGEPPRALFIAGSGVDVGALRSRIAANTSMAVHAPSDGDLALARGAALAAVHVPRFDAETVGLRPPTPLRPPAVSRPLRPRPESRRVVEAEPEPVSTERKPLALAGALGSVFVAGVVALMIALSLTARPGTDQRAEPAATGVAPTSAAPAPAAAAPETIQAPVPVVREAPRTVYVTPPAAPVPEIVPPASVSVPAPEIVPPAPVSVPAPEPAAVIDVPVAPAVPPIVLPPILPRLFPGLFELQESNAPWWTRLPGPGQRSCPPFTGC